MIKVIVLFGGVSAEHEVSVISGLQVIEKIDRNQFDVYALKLGQDGLFYYYPGLINRKQYLRIKPQVINFGRDNGGVYFASDGFLKNKIYIDAAYLAFHGGNGESGQIQGLLEIFDIPYTSPSSEASTISMNKSLTKQVLSSCGIETLSAISVSDKNIKDNVDEVIKNIKLKLPVIVKPVHLGSSIAINVAKTEIELKKYLLEAAHIDSEILIEKFLQDFDEYNISVRKVAGKLECSEIERPLSKDEILSFADKYQRGGKKTGGMASLNRELPAQISPNLAKQIKQIAIKVFEVIRAKGMIRIDFMTKDKKIYVTEVNPIPGSMSYYLWEASGISFKDQITDLLNQAIEDNQSRLNKRLEYKTDIIEKFVSNIDR